MRSVLFLALAGVGLAAGGCAGRREAPRHVELPRVLLSADALVFTAFDANGDRRIDAGERDAGVAREWSKADANEDGALQPLEFQTWMTNALGGSNAPPYRLDFDRNVDNAITRAEFEQEFTARFNDYDADKDGALMRAEFLRDMPRPQFRDGSRPQMQRRQPPG